MFIQINPELCTGCQICEAFCSFRAEKAVWPAKSRISVIKWEKEGIYIPFTCLQCEKPICGEVCPVNAITREASTGAMEVDPQLCLGCKMCVMACPFGGVSFDRDRGCAVKCDLCKGDPECVKLCAPGALDFIREERLALEKRRQYAAKLSSFIQAPGGERGVQV